MKLRQISPSLNGILKTINAIEMGFGEIGFEAAEPIQMFDLNIDKYDRQAFVDITEAFNFAITQYNALITRHVLIDEFGKRPTSVRDLKFSSLTIHRVDIEMKDKLKQLKDGLAFVVNASNLMGVTVEYIPEEPPIEPPKEPDKPTPPVIPDKPKEPEVKPPVQPEVPQLKPFPKQVINRGWKRVKEFPERGWPGIQGTGIDNEWYYTFGKRSNTDTKLRLIVTNRFDDKKSFIATGDIGDYDNWDKDPAKNPLGHTNGVTVLSRNGNEVTLLIATMHTGQVATAIVDLGKKSVRTGRTTTLTGSAGETIGAVTSVQKMADGKILFKASNYYWWGEYRQDRIVVTKAFKWNNTTALEQIRKLFGQNFVKSVVGQADWFEDGYLYSISWSDNWEKCFVFELIPNGPNNTAIWSNRMWWDEVKGRRFEPENIWFEGNQMKSGISMNTPYDAFIAELNFKK